MERQKNPKEDSGKEVMNVRELESLMAVTLDYNYQMGFGSLLGICNQIQEDTFFDSTVGELFNGRPIVFEHKSAKKEKILTDEALLKAADEFRTMYPEIYVDIGGGDGYMPAVGTKILLVALFGWAQVATDIGDEFSRFLVRQ